MIANMSESPPTAVGFVEMSKHGEAVRQRDSHGTVIFSRLTTGASRIVALAPSVRFVAEGEETYLIEGRSRRVRAGEFLLVESGTDSVARVSGEAVGLCVYFPARSALLSMSSEIGCSAVIGAAIDPLSRTIRRHVERLMENTPLSPDTRALIDSVSCGVDDFFGRLGQSRRSLSHARTRSKTEMVERLERLRAYMHANAEKPLTLDELSNEASVSRFHLARVFAEVYGVPPLTYHRALRLEAAAARLRRKAASPTQVADDLGYANLSAFTRAFRNKYGMPPSEFLRQTAAQAGAAGKDSKNW